MQVCLISSCHIKPCSNGKLQEDVLALMKCSGNLGKGGGGGVVGERRSVEQIQSLTLEVRTRVNIDLNLHVATLTLFYANMTPTGLYAVIKIMNPIAACLCSCYCNRHL